MYDEQAFLRIIGKLIQQVEEERCRREEVIRAFALLSSIKSTSIKEPSKEEIEKRIAELQ